MGLYKKGEVYAAISEYQKCLSLQSKDMIHPDSFDFDGKVDLVLAHVNLGAAFEDTGDLDGAIAEYRHAIQLDPKSGDAHFRLGSAIGKKGDVDGEIAEYHEALRLNPKAAVTHYNLGVAFVRKGDLQAALQEYRVACELNPKDANYRQLYEDLLTQVSH